LACHQPDTTSLPVTASADEKHSVMLSIFPKSPRTVVWMGITLHLTYLLAMFDTFFHSPIVHVGVHHPVSTSNVEPLADRVVLMVGECSAILRWKAMQAFTNIALCSGWATCGPGVHARRIAKGASWVGRDHGTISSVHHRKERSVRAVPYESANREPAWT
jgi:hypothetical protein